MIWLGLYLTGYLTIAAIWAVLAYWRFPWAEDSKKWIAAGSVAQGLLWPLGLWFFLYFGWTDENQPYS